MGGWDSILMLKVCCIVLPLPFCLCLSLWLCICRCGCLSPCLCFIDNSIIMITLLAKYCQSTVPVDYVDGWSNMVGKKVGSIILVEGCAEVNCWQTMKLSRYWVDAGMLPETALRIHSVAMQQTGAIPSIYPPIHLSICRDSPSAVFCTIGDWTLIMSPVTCYSIIAPFVSNLGYVNWVNEIYWSLLLCIWIYN